MSEELEDGTMTEPESTTEKPKPELTIKVPAHMIASGNMTFLRTRNGNKCCVQFRDLDKKSFELEESFEEVIQFLRDNIPEELFCTRYI